MSRIVRGFLTCVALIAILVNNARAFPGSGGNCASCHTDTNGTFNFSPVQFT